MDKNFKPTWLYIKQHNQTGLKYFGKTIGDPNSYRGSGVYWNRHLAKHGEDVTTIWSQLFIDKEELIKFAVEFSLQNKIVELKEWANLIIENGETGGDNPYSYTPESRKKQSAAKKGRIVTEETRAKLSMANKGKIRTAEQNLQNSLRQKGQPGQTGSINGMFGKTPWNKGIKTGTPEKAPWNKGIKTGPNPKKSHPAWNKKVPKE